MSVSLAVAILDVNLKGPTATFDEQGLSAVRWAWETVKATLPADRGASVAAAERSGEACAGKETRDEQINPPPNLEGK